MDKSTVEAVLFAAAAVLAAVHAVREDIVPKVNKLAAAIALIAAGYFVMFQSVFH